MKDTPFVRTGLLVGEEGLQKLRNSKVIVFGVGSYVVEALARSGVGQIVIIDNDTIDISNLNRQIHATLDTIGEAKVDIEKQRILSINKDCIVTAHRAFILEDNLKDYIESDADYIVDAIDTVSAKIAIAKYCDDNNLNLISSMGTGNKFDPTMFKIADIYDTKVCPLAKVMRHELKKREVKKLKVLYSEEVPVKPRQIDSESNQKQDVTKKRVKVTPGSISFVPSVAGLIIGGEVIKYIINKSLK